MFWYPYVPWVDTDVMGGSAGTASRPRHVPNAVDALLVEVAYTVMAAECACSRCGAALGRGLRIASARRSDRDSRWDLSIETACTGWRRHRHVANASGRAREVLLGPFERKSAQPGDRVRGAGADPIRPTRPT